jgi:superfamily II DNA or RNA helicase
MQLFSGTERPPGFGVVYNLYLFAEEVYLPNAYVVSRDQEGGWAHIKQKALPVTIGGFGLELDPVRGRLFALIDDLQPKTLEKQFNVANKRPVALEKLLRNEELKPVIIKKIHSKLNEFLRLVVEHRLPLTWDVERKVLVKDFILETSDQELEPSLFFKKSEEGVLYRLRLADESGEWTISSREVIPVTNHPAWLVVDHQLRPAAHINGNMVKPFRGKDELFIPKTSLRSYFQRFILKVASRLDIEAEGFDLIQHDRLLACRLEPVQDIFKGHWVLAVKMAYEKTEFLWSDKKQNRTLLEFGDDDEPRLFRIQRDAVAEGKFIKKLKSFDLTLSTGHYFEVVDAQSGDTALLEWLSSRREPLEKAGFTIVEPHIEEKQIYLHPGRLGLDVSEENDWFDLHGQVVAGEFTFPFMALARYIREENPYYPLPNGSFFLIPREWMARYRELARFARREQNSLRIARSQFTLLQDLGIALSSDVGQELEEVDYRPSSRLSANLRPYQLEGVKWLVKLYHNQLGACLADDMGLGKTLQTIAVLLHAKENLQEQEDGNGQTARQLNLFGGAPDDRAFLKPLNALVVLPASLVFNWEEEIRKFAPDLNVYRHVGPKRYTDERLLVRFDIILTTYQTALRDVDLLGKIPYEYIVLDESQQIKNKDSKVFKAINLLEARHKVSLSGTPIENSLSDLWSQMQFINPDLLGSFNFFSREFIRPIEKQRDEEQKARLRKLVAPYLLRRTKEEVARDLPPLTTQLFYSEMTPEQKRLYEKEKSKARNYLLDNYRDDDPKYRVIVLQTLTRLRQLVNHPALVIDTYAKESGKFTDVVEHWEQVRKGGHKALIFSSFVKYLELFRKVFEQEQIPFSWLTGSLGGEQRRREIERFEKDPAVQAFLISIKAGGVGLNLTAADYVFILDPWWNPTIEQQAIARAHRIGQDKSVIALKFITRDSIEEKILKLQERKLQLVEDILGKTPSARFTRKDLEYLLE